MAMIYCRDCGAKHSDRARACPKCGRAVASCEDKTALVYILLAFFVGCWGVHKFYAGRTGEGIAMLLMGTIGWLLILPGVAVCIWAFVDFIMGIINMNHPGKIFKK
ncbi:MAG: NINE protein [Alphaproteobacteria bacterium]|nr:NINE protein [Alphaproteobacteria bacterium]